MKSPQPKTINEIQRAFDLLLNISVAKALAGQLEPEPLMLATHFASVLAWVLGEDNRQGLDGFTRVMKTFEAFMKQNGFIYDGNTRRIQAIRPAVFSNGR